jgi:imidazolonepropionase-like amidohydrolase
MNNNKTAILIRAFFLFLLSLSLAGGLSFSAEKAVYVKAKKIYSCDKSGILDNGGLLIEGGKIIRVDKKPRPPENARVIDFSDKIIVPGLIDAHCALGFHEEDFSVKTEPPPPEGTPIFWLMPAPPEMPPMPEARFQSAQAVFYKDFSFMKSLAGGITSAKIAIPADYLVDGTSACVKLFADSASDLILKNPAGEEFSFVVKENATERYAELKKLFLEAQEYEKGFKKYEQDLKIYLDKKKAKDQKKEAQAQKQEPAEQTLEEPKEPRKDENQEIILQVLMGKIPAMIRASRINEIEAAVKIAEEFKLNLVLVGGQEAYRIAGEVATKRIPVIAGPEAVYVKKGEKINYIKALLSKNVPVAFSSQSNAGTPFLPFQLTYAVQYGLTEEEALNVLTINAARILGIADKVGTLEAGKDADFVVLSGEPFEFGTKVEKVYVNGKVAYPKE